MRQAELGVRIAGAGIVVLSGAVLSSCTLRIQGHTPEPVQARAPLLYTYIAPTSTFTPVRLTDTPWFTVAPAAPRPTRTATSTPPRPIDCVGRGMLPTPQGEPSRLSFEPGTTSLMSPQVAIGECETDAYVLRLREREWLAVQLWPEVAYEARGLLEIRITGLGDGWTPTDDSGSSAAVWMGRLPTTQDYEIEVTNRGAATRYSLSVDVPRSLDLAASGGRITLPGAAALECINTYEFHADEGDRFSIEVTSSDGGVCFSLEDPDRQPIERYWPSGEVLEVPALLTGDYTILAGGFCGAVEGVEYTITVEVSD